MARYYFHLRDGDDRLTDPDGADLADMEAARSHALRSARTILGHELVDDGILNLNCGIDVEDESGAIVHHLRFADAVRIIAPSH